MIAAASDLDAGRGGRAAATSDEQQAVRNSTCRISTTTGRGAAVLGMKFLHASVAVTAECANLAQAAQPPVATGVPGLLREKLLRKLN